jgi:Protein-L-isoaspartate(D-aspartate) O-methyltransferase (PCMT)
MRRRAFFTIIRVAAAALPLTAALTIRGAAQDFTAPSGAPADVFPRPERPVADIVSPIWHGEKERDAAGEPRQLARLLGIKPGMTVADIGAGSGYYVVRLAPIVGPKGRIIAEDVVPEYLQDLRNRVRALGLQNVTISLGETPRSSAASATTPGMRPASIGFLKTLSIPIVGPIGTWRRRIAVTQTTREKV